VLAAYAMSRRPGSQRAFALFVVAVALLCFAATAADVSRRGREERAAVELGAVRVLRVADVTRGGLLAKVRAADPEGRFAMAVARVPSKLPDEPAKLAVDSSRLAAVAAWPDSGVPANEVAERLRPAAREPTVLRGTDPLSADVTVRQVVDGFRLRLVVSVAPLSGEPGDRVDLGPVQAGRHTYSAPLPACRDGCRVASIEVVQPEGRGFGIDLVVHRLAQRGAPVAGALLDRPDAWRAPLSPGPKLLVPDVVPGPDGLAVHLADSKGNDVAMRAVPTDNPVPVPVVVARGARAPDYVSGFDGGYYQAESIARVTAVPRLGRVGTLLDYEYAERATIDTGGAEDPEVWLGPAAPSDAVDRLRAQGLTITGERGLAPLRRAFDRQGPSVALRFHELAAGFAVVLAMGALWLVAGLDRRQRIGELRALRVQGLSRRDAGVAGYLPAVAVAVALGPVAAMVSWLLARDAIPVFTDGGGPVDPPRWPSFGAVAVPWLVATVALAAVAWLAGLRLRRAVDSGGAG
jgi:hypothetical protein